MQARHPESAHPHSIPRRPTALVWLAVLAVLLPAVLGLWLVVRIEQAAYLRLGEARLALGRSAVAQVTDALQSARLTIESATRRPGLKRWTLDRDAEQATAVLRNLLEGPVPFAAVVIVDAEGAVFARHPPDAAAPTIEPSGSVTVEDVHHLLIAAPVADQGGQPAATLYGRLPLTSVLDDREAMRFGETGAVSLVTHDGWVVASADAQRAGRQLQAGPLRELLARGGQGVVDYHAAALARREFSALVAVPGLPLAVLVSQAFDEAFLPSARLRTALLLVGATQLVILLGIAWLGLRSLLAYEQALRDNAARLASANAELEAFSYTVAHDLRAPLRAVDGYAHMLEEDHGATLDAGARRYITTIRDNATRMGRLIDDLLALSRIGRQPLDIAALETEAMVAELLDEVRASNPAAERCRFDVGPLPVVAADRQLLRQVWFNLLDNAVKYSAKAKEPVVSVRAERAAGEVRFEVADNGVGFDMAYYPKLFGVFQRLHHDEEFEGTGVGLAIVARIVARHGGRVWAEASPGAGARFHFTLPHGGTPA